MKIIGKKDYYDYLAGIWGIDEKLVFDRCKTDNPTYGGGVYCFFICGKGIDGWFDDVEKRFYFLDDVLIKFPKKTSRWRNPIDYSPNSISIPTVNGRFGEHMNLKIVEDKKKINEKFNCPIVCCRYSALNYEPSYHKFPLLSQTGIAKVLPPEDIYLMLVEWVGREKVIVDNRGDADKILSAGFDLKSSFRNIK
jgi:hypothetical protein